MICDKRRHDGYNCFRPDVGLDVVQLLAGIDSHDQIFKSRVTCTFTDSKNSTFYLTRPGFDRSQGIGNG